MFPKLNNKIHAAEAESDSEDECAAHSDDHRSLRENFGWKIIGTISVPYLLKNDNVKYVCIRMAELDVLSPFFNKLSEEVWDCVYVKSFSISPAEETLLCNINKNHCQWHYGPKSFTVDDDFIMKLDDLVEFYNFLETCHAKLIASRGWLQEAISSCNNNRCHSDKCGFVRIDDDSVLPYAVKNCRKYVPLFYFVNKIEDALKPKAIRLKNWELAYLKFCCKVQGIENKQLYNEKQWLAISLEDIKLYFPHGTAFEYYWPSGM